VNWELYDCLVCELILSSQVCGLQPIIASSFLFFVL